MQTTKRICFKKNLTEVYVKNLHAGTDLQITDEGLVGLQLRYSAATERKVYYLWYRVRSSKVQRHMRLGGSDIFDLNEARAVAIGFKKEVANGQDPCIERRERAKATAIKESRHKKVKDLAPLFMEKHSKVNNRESTYKSHYGYFKNHIVPILGDMYIEDVNLAAVQNAYDKVRDYSTPSLGDHIVRVISVFLNWCEKYDYRTLNSNPCHLVTKVKKARFKPTLLDKERYDKLLAALDVALVQERYAPQPILALKTLILTGCRCGEITDLEMDELDLENGYLHLNKRKTDFFDVPLAEPAIEVIRQALAVCRSKRYVFHSPIDHTRPLSDLRKVFWWALDRAGLPIMRVHDLRHSFATMATSIGEDIRTLKDVLGHTKITTTEIYAHTTNNAARRVANNTATAILGQI